MWVGDTDAALSVPYVHCAGFAVDGRGGNDAGVVLPGDGAALSDRQRCAVAAKLGFSETVFITSLRGGARSCNISLRCSLAAHADRDAAASARRRTMRTKESREV